MSSNPSPLDAVQYGPNDVASPSPVDTSSLPVQTPADQIVPPAPDVAGGVQPNQMPDVQGSNPTAAAQPPAKPAMWKQILIGSLQGLAAGGGNPMGLVRGAVSTAVTGETPVQQMREANAERQDAIQTSLRFKHFQAATAAAENQIYNHNLEMLPTEDQRAAENQNLRVGEFLIRAGWQPTAVGVHDQQGAARATLQQLATANNGEIPESVNLRVGGKTLVFTPPSQDIDQTQLDGLNELNRMAGLPEIPNVQAFNALPEKARGDAFMTAIRLNRSESTPTLLPGAIARDKGILQRLKITRPWDSAAQNLVQGRIDAETQALTSHTKLANDHAEFVARQSAARKADTNMYEGTDRAGNEVAGTADELHNAGISNYTKMPALQQNQTLAARDLTAPNGLFVQARQQLLALNKAGKLGAVASRYNNFWAKKGMDGDQQAFRDTLALIATKLMQAHMGNRGGKDAMEHFANLVPENSTPAAFMSALNSEYQYVTGLAKRPKAVKNVQ